MFPLILCTYRPYVPTDAMLSLILCFHRSSVITNPLFPLILCTCWFYVLTDPIFQLILCSRWAWRHILKGKADGVHLKNHLLRRRRFSRFSDGIWQDMIRKVIKLYRPTELLLWVPWSLHGSNKSKISRTHTGVFQGNPLILCFHWTYVSSDPTFSLILCYHWRYVPINPMFPLMLCSLWSHISTDAIFLLILCSHWFCFHKSYVPTDCVFPLILPDY